MEEKKNYIVINFKTGEVKENKLDPISDYMLIKVAKMICHYINYYNRTNPLPES